MKFSFRMSKHLYKVFPTLLQNFFTISLKLERNIFNVLRNFRKINNLKLPRCFCIIFPELMQNLLFLNFFEVFRRFCENIQKNSTKYRKNVLKISNISPKFSASIPKYVFQNSTNVHIFSKFFER